MSSDSARLASCAMILFDICVALLLTSLTDFNRHPPTAIDMMGGVKSDGIAYSFYWE